MFHIKSISKRLQHKYSDHKIFNGEKNASEIKKYIFDAAFCNYF